MNIMAAVEASSEGRKGATEPIDLLAHLSPLSNPANRIRALNWDYKTQKPREKKRKCINNERENKVEKKKKIFPQKREKRWEKDDTPNETNHKDQNEREGRGKYTSSN